MNCFSKLCTNQPTKDFLSLHLKDVSLSFCNKKSEARGYGRNNDMMQGL